MKITGIETVPFALPARRDFRWAGMRADVGSFVLVRLRTDEGLEGLGEATPLPDWGGDFQRRGGETVATVRHIVEALLAPALVGADPLAIAPAVAAMDGVVRGHSYAKAAVDMALHDLAGKALGVPVHRLLGGPARGRVAVAHMVGLMPADEAVAEALAAVGEGAAALQIKGGVDPDRDVAAVLGIREAVGPGVTLRLDANQGYRRAKAALRVLDRMGGALDLVEQPVEGLEEMAAVVAASPVAVVADESCWNPADALDVVRTRACDAVSIYLAKAGGLYRARQVAAITGAANLPCDVNGSLESGIGNAANLQFALAVPEVTLACVIPVTQTASQRSLEVAGAYYADDIVTASLPVEGANLLPPAGSGLGVELDLDKLDRYRTG